MNPESDVIEQLTTMADEAARLENAMLDLTSQLEVKKRRHGHLTEKLIPELMDQHAIKLIQLACGILEVKQVIRASIPNDRYEEGIQWFDDSGNSGLVKREFTISFTRDEEKWANKFHADLKKRKLPLHMKMERWIEPQTLKKFVTTKLEEGEDIPTDLLGVFRQRIAKITQPKD